MATRYKALQKHLSGILNNLKETGTYKTEKVLSSPMQNYVTIDNKQVISFGSNNYLGLGNHPEINETAKNTINNYGFGSASARSIVGTSDLHLRLEQKVSEFHKTEATIIYNSCLDANTGFFETILGSEDAIFSDSLNHASIIDGVRLCKAKRYRYKHNDMKDLEEQLKTAMDRRFRLICTDGVFSMDGDLAPVDKLINLADKYDAILFVDDCHATGVLGKTGRGTSEYFDVMGHVDVITSTFGKAMGGSNGGFTTGRQEIIDYLRQGSRTYMFSNNMSPSVTAAS